jgi:hypothetical protein
VLESILFNQPSSHRAFCSILKIITETTQFGASHNPPAQPSDDSDSEDEQDIDDTQAWPRVEEWKMNLTVLSQYYNVRQTF